MATRPTSAELLPKLERLLASRITHREMLRGLEVLAQEGPLGELTYRYGPDLYARDRALFGRFIVHHFATARTEKQRWVAVRYKDHAQQLDPWLEAVDLARDVELFRRLWSWKHAHDPKRWLADLRGRHARAVTAPERAEVRELYQGLAWRALDEDVALELYRDDRAASAFILSYAPMRSWTGGGTRWLRLERAAQAGGDEAFALELYRRMVGDAELAKDLRAIAEDRTLGGARLADALDRRTPAWPRRFAKIALELLELRGADAVPYLLRHVRHLPLGSGRSTRSEVRTLIDKARASGHFDLWARALQSAASNKDFDELLRQLLGPGSPDQEVLADLARLAGVVDELNFSGLGLARIRALDDETAVLFHQRFPALLRARWKSSLFVGWHQSYAKLTERLIEVEDHELLDYVASRLVTRDVHHLPKEAQGSIELLAAYYEGLRHDEAQFATRATHILSQVPAFAVVGFDRVIHDNRLGRLLFLRAHAALLSDARGLGDLLEAPNIHVQALAFRTLGGDDPRAPAIAAAQLRVLLATLLRPLHRKTRVLAFAALANAAHTPATAQQILRKCREALAMPEASYPREPLIGLMAQLLHRFPTLRGPQETPRVHRRPEVPA